jgi:hypothetical protein
MTRRPSLDKALALGLVLAVILVAGLLFEIYGGDGGRTSTSAPAAAWRTFSAPRALSMAHSMP